MNSVYLFLSPIAASWAVLYGAAVAQTATECGVAYGAAVGLAVAWRLALRRRDHRVWRLSRLAAHDWTIQQFSGAGPGRVQ